MKAGWGMAQLAECRPACPKLWLQLLTYYKLGTVTVVHTSNPSGGGGGEEKSQKFKDKPGWQEDRTGWTWK